MLKLNQQRFGKILFYRLKNFDLHNVAEEKICFEQVLHRRKIFLWKRCGLKEFKI
jgi:hypothetical protein